jgi:hypothetical protein
MTKLFHTCNQCQSCDNCEIRTESNTVLFRMRNPHYNSKGDTYEDSHYSWINVSAHETMADLLDTITHESIHVAMKREDMNIDAEHNIMKHMAWAGEDWV